MITSFFSPKGKKGASQSTSSDGGAAAPAAATSTNSEEDERKRGRTAAAVTPTDSSSGPNSSSGTKRAKTTPSPSSPRPTAALFGDKPGAGSAEASSAGRSLSAEVEDLLSYMNDADASTNDGTKTWRQALDQHVHRSNFTNLARFVASERKSGKKIYPPPADIFSALNLTPLHKVKVVIVGQDPYHGPNQGHGLAFSVRRGVAVPPSLRNIYKELINDDNVAFPNKIPSHGYLEKWARQGVLMLNAVLTVRGGEANSHKNRGWEAFTDECIRAIDKECQARKKAQQASGGSTNSGVVFLLWGKPASKKADSIIRKSSGHEIICTSHPSPLGATKTASPFLGSKCFSRANEALVERGMEPIDWSIE